MSRILITIEIDLSGKLKYMGPFGPFEIIYPFPFGMDEIVLTISNV